MTRVITFASCVLLSMPLSAETPTLVRTSEQWQGRRVSYLVQSASDHKLRLNANNGFFDRGFIAAGQKPVPADEKKLISAHFEYLVLRVGGADVTARWHVMVVQPGELTIQPQFTVPNSERKARWELSIGDVRRTFVPGADNVSMLRFRIKKSGRHMVVLRRVQSEVAGETRIQELVLSGSAARNAGIIRARWRPAAIHTQYASSTCPTTKMWVIETQSVAPVSSYSPITTRFGYFGASFDSAGRASGGVNFSMWAASRKAEKAPPLNEMPHLLATGNPQAEFSGFGHEGSGVKIRGWEPFAHHPRSVIQALRIETQDGHDTWSGYVFDERTQSWTLYAVGRRPTKLRRGETEAFLRPASFCEVPGPPSVQRSGDIRRIIRRRGWFFGDGGKWHPIDRQTSGNSRKKSEPVNQFIAAEDGWFLMGTGGVEMLESVAEVNLPRSTGDLPTYLQPNVANQLFELPVTFGQSSADVNRTTATVRYDLKDSGTAATAVLYYGPVDCLTFVPRKLHGTEKKGVSAPLLSADRVWAHAIPSQSVSRGRNEFRLKNLKPGTRYFYRLLVANKQGKSWAYESGSFKTE